MQYPVPRILTAATLLALGACAASARHETDQQVADRYNAYAGEPIDHFSWLGHYDSWEPVGRHELVLKTGVSDAYLIKVGPPCDSLPFANRIGFTSTTGTVYTRVDAIITNGWRCPIEEIRKVDYQRLRADMRLEAQKAKAATQSQ